MPATGDDNQRHTVEVAEEPATPWREFMEFSKPDSHPVPPSPPELPSPPPELSPPPPDLSEITIDGESECAVHSVLIVLPAVYDGMNRAT